jgi:hypothetical protein
MQRTDSTLPSLDIGGLDYERSMGSTPARGEKMSILAFVCPAIGVQVSTGIEMDLATLDSLEFPKVHCSHCRQTHQLAGMHYWITAENEFGRSDDDGFARLVRAGAASRLTMVPGRSSRNEASTHSFS